MNLNKYDFVIGVPFSGMENMVTVPYKIAPREDIAIAIAFGAMLAGKKPLVFMQNSGFGLCVDIITSLLKPCKTEIPLLIYNRHKPDHHKYMGEVTKSIIKKLAYKEVYLIEEN